MDCQDTGHELSERQRRIFLFIANYIEQRGYAPSVREIAKGADISSTSLVQHHIGKLEVAGYLSHTQSIARGLRVRKWPEELQAE